MPKMERTISQTYKCIRCHKLIYFYKGMTPGELDIEMSKHAREEGIVKFEDYSKLFELVTNEE